MKKGGLFTIFLIVAIDLLGFGLILPLLPFYAETFGANPVQIGLLVSVYAASQFIGSPLLGRVSDRFGRRPILLLSILGTVLSFILLGFANSLLILFASRILDGFTGGNISVAQAYITDITDEKNRAKGLGLIGAAFGLGFVFGPAIGGALSTFGYSVPAFAAAGLSFVSFLGVIFFLPESVTPERRLELKQKQQQEFSLRNFVTAIKRPKVGPLLHIRFFYGLAFAAFQSIFALYAEYQLGFGAQETGYVLAYVGLLLVIVQGFGIGLLTKYLSEKQLLLWGAVVIAISFLAWGFTANIWLLLLVLLPLSTAAGVLNTILNSLLTKSVSEDEFGGILGLSSSVESLTRVISPSVSGFVLAGLGPWAPGVLSFLLMGWTVTYIRLHIGREKKSQAEELLIN